MTSVFMIFELTQDYQILVPLMVANALSFAISRHYQPVPVYHALLEQNKIHLPGPEQRLAGSWRVRDAMLSRIELTDPNTLIKEMPTRFSESSMSCVLLGNDRALAGLVAKVNVDRALEAGRGDEPVRAIAAEDFDYVYPDQPLESAVSRIGSTPGILPVVDRANGRRIEGLITVGSILEFIQKRSA
jgi:CIC family chloride channel protein